MKTIKKPAKKEPSNAVKKLAHKMARELADDLEAVERIKKADKKAGKPAKAAESSSEPAKPAKPATDAPELTAALRRSAEDLATIRKTGKGPADWDSVEAKRCRSVPKTIDAKPVTPYRACRVALECEGTLAAIAHCLHLELPRAQAKAYVRELLIILDKQRIKAATKAAASKPKTVRTKLSDWSPHFRYASHDKATRSANKIARRCGLSQGNFHILEEAGRFAIAPIHYMPPHDAPLFSKGDEVMDTIIPNSRGKIVDAGPEQCLVRYVDDGAERVVPNYYLYKLSDLTKEQKAEIKANLPIVAKYYDNRKKDKRGKKKKG